MVGVTGDPTDRLRSLFEHHPDGVYDLDAEGRFLAANPAMARLAGHAVDELVGRPFHDLVVVEDLPFAVEAFELALGGETARYEARGVRPDGHVYDVDVTNLPVLVDGEVVGVQGLARDVTVSRATRRALDRSRSLLRMAGQLARVGGWQFDLTTGEMTWSAEVPALLGVTRSVLGLDEALALHPPEAREEVRSAIEACGRDGTPFDLEVPMHPRPGRELWVRLVGEAVHDGHGQVVAVRGALQDIQQRRAAEAERRELAERLTATFMGITDAMLVLDRRWRVTFLNPGAVELLRRRPPTLLGRVLWEEVPSLAGGTIEDTLRRVGSSGRSERSAELLLPGTSTWVELNVVPFHDGLSVFLRDVTGAREAREELRRHAARLREQAELLDNASDAIVVRDTSGRVTYWNRGAEALYGWPAEDALGCRVRDLLYGHPAAHDEATEAVLRDGEWQGELHQVDREGRERLVETRWTLARDEDGEPQSVLEISTDVTERRHAEATARRAQRMESLGTLASGMAHDLNNALSPVLMAVQLLRVELDEGERDQILDMVEETTRHGANLVEQVLSFARGVEGRRLPVDVGGLIDEVARLVRDTFPPSIRWQADVADDVRPVVGDATQLHQVLVNLVVNGRDAMPDGGRLLVRAENVDLAELPTDRPADVEPGAFVRIEVVDAGTGMAPEVRERVFEPFFTTKASGHGTGLGLATSHGIIESHGGFVQVESALGEGTRFVVHLPASTDPTAPSAPRRTSGPRGRGEHLLLVEDQPGVRHSTARALRANGYEVLAAEDGESAVAIVAEGADRIDLVLTDLMMPGIDGVETVRQIRALRPDMPAVITSGLVHEVAEASAGLDVPFLPKPYGTERLLEVVSEALAGRDAPAG